MRFITSTINDNIHKFCVLDRKESQLIARDFRNYENYQKICLEDFSSKLQYEENVFKSCIKIGTVITERHKILASK